MAKSASSPTSPTHPPQAFYIALTAYAPLVWRKDDADITFFPQLRDFCDGVKPDRGSPRVLEILEHFVAALPEEVRALFHDKACTGPPLLNVASVASKKKGELLTRKQQHRQLRTTVRQRVNRMIDRAFLVVLEDAAVDRCRAEGPDSVGYVKDALTPLLIGVRDAIEDDAEEAAADDEAPETASASSSEAASVSSPEAASASSSETASVSASEAASVSSSEASAADAILDEAAAADAAAAAAIVDVEADEEGEEAPKPSSQGKAKPPKAALDLLQKGADEAAAYAAADASSSSSLGKRKPSREVADLKATWSSVAKPKAAAPPAAKSEMAETDQEEEEEPKKDHKRAKKDRKRAKKTVVEVEGETDKEEEAEDDKDAQITSLKKELAALKKENAKLERANKSLQQLNKQLEAEAKAARKGSVKGADSESEDDGTHLHGQKQLEDPLLAM